MKKLNTKGGFTLIELLVVVLIIGILSSIALPQYTKAVEKARASEAMTWLSDYVTAQNVYHMSRDAFGTALSDLDIGLPDANIMKNFTVGTPALGSITLTRNGGSKVYSLKVTMSYDEPTGVVKAKRECTGESANSDICKTITNGVTCGSFSDANETSWCYTAAAS